MATHKLKKHDDFCALTRLKFTIQYQHTYSHMEGESLVKEVVPKLKSIMTC